MWLRKWCFFLIFCAGTALASGGDLPRVDENIDPAKSFWADHVHYAYPHQFARVADGQGRMWEIAYLDVFRGPPEARAKAPVLVLLHGRAMNSGYWGELMEKPLAAGWRVISIDWSHGGKSLPKNLDLPVVRSFDDVRQIVFNLVVKHLGIAKASYLGHSMGGQLAAGYALRYPTQVERLVLYAPGGLGTFPAIERNGFRYDDPELVKQPEKFLTAWKAGILPSIGSTQEQVERSFYVPARPGSMPYLQRGSALSEFMVASRAGVLRGNPRERERFQQAYAWDTLAALSECRLEDADSLPNRVVRLKVPTMLALGLKEPIVSLDSVQPVYLLARSNQSPIQIKLYENAGHIIHTDLPGQFSADVLAFLQTGKVAEPVYAGGALYPERKPLAALPAEVQRFKERAEVAWSKRDLEQIQLAIYHPEFREDGQSLKERLDFFASFVGMVSSWQLNVYDVQRQGETMVLDIDVKNNFGVFPGKIILKQAAGEWLSYGNQK